MKTTTNRLVSLAAGALGFTAAYHLISAATRDRVIEHKNIRIRSEKIPAELSGFQFAFITDTHYVSEKKLQDAIHQLRARKPDLLLLGGDFPDSRAPMRRQMQLIRKAQPPYGIYGVCGNHDNRQALREEMEALSMTLLENTGVSLPNRLYLGGVQDFLKGRPDTAGAMADVQEGDFTLLLCHNPDLAMLHSLEKVDLMLSGHTHGGQMNLFGLYAPALSLVSDFGQTFREGPVRVDGKTVYVSRGVGNHRHLFRVLSQPQILYFTLERKESRFSGKGDKCGNE